MFNPLNSKHDTSTTETGHDKNVATPPAMAGAKLALLTQSVIARRENRPSTRVHPPF